MRGRIPRQSETHRIVYTQSSVVLRCNPGYDPHMNRKCRRRRIVARVAALGFLSVVHNGAARDLQTTTGVVYKDAKITRSEPDGLTISHATGVAKVPFVELPADIQRKYHYDPARAAEYQTREHLRTAARGTPTRQNINNTNVTVERGANGNVGEPNSAGSVASNQENKQSHGAKPQSFDEAMAAADRWTKENLPESPSLLPNISNTALVGREADDVASRQRPELDDSKSAEATSKDDPLEAARRRFPEIASVYEAKIKALDGLIAALAAPNPAHKPAARRRSVAHRAAALGGASWIEAVSQDGSIITLADGSIWKVSTVDQIDTALWLPVTDVEIVDGNEPGFPHKMINKDDDEVANVRLLSSGD
jgi:hypothetical protein